MDPKNVIEVNRQISERRMTHGRKFGYDDKVYVGDIKENSLRQLDCIDPNSDEACKLVVRLCTEMIGDICKKNGYHLNEKETKIVKN